MAMAHHGYLEQEGGQLMIEFIVKQCALLPDTQQVNAIHCFLFFFFLEKGSVFFFFF